MKKLIISIIFLILFIIATTFKDVFLSLDTTIMNYMIEINSENLTTIFSVITQFGGGVVLIILTLILGFIYKKKFPLIASTLAFSFLLNELFKNVIRKARPEYALSLEHGFSFPSGHSMVSMSFYGILIYLIFQSKQKMVYKIVESSILILLVLSIGFSRLYLRVHYFSDVLYGLVLGMIFLNILINVKNNFFKK